MELYSNTTTAFVFATLFITYVLSFLRRARNAVVKQIAGPPSSSWFFGSMRELMLSSEYGQHEFEWQEKHGLVYRIKGCFGEDRLMISDPSAVRHVLAETSTFQRSPQQQQIVRMLVGEWSVFHVTGDDHRRIRAVMNPAFSAANVRTLRPLLQQIATQMSDQWKEQLSSTEGSVINVSPSLHHATLDVIGEAILGMQFNTLENNKSELARTHLNLVAMSSACTESSILMDGVLRYLPLALLRLLLRLPTASVQHLRRNRELTAKIATELIHTKAEAFRRGFETGKDLLSLLVNANATLNGSKMMSATEMRDQVGAIMVAGQETSASTISWVMYELARDPEAQATLRAEISETYAKARARGESEPSYTDLEEMKYLNAYIKETLRFYSALPMSERRAVEDAILPLSQSIRTTSGEHITELPVTKGQILVVATSAYHRATSVWGPDANIFRASRWLQDDICIKGGSLGPYGNLLCFLGGPRTCIGWRLAITEIQTFVIEMIRNFSFSVPHDTTVRASLALTLFPVTGGESKKQCLRLHVKVLE